MNIWVIGRNYPQKNNQMQGSFELEQAKLLAEKGHEVTYIAVVFHPTKKVKNWGYAQWKEDHVTICIESQFYTPARLGLHLKGFEESKWKKHLERVERIKGTPDIIHVHYPALITQASPILAYQKKGSKVVATEHWSHTLNGLLTKNEKEQLISYLTYSDAFICVGSGLKKAVAKLAKSKREIQVVPNIVDCNLFQLSKEMPRNQFNFVVVGRLISEKQCDQIIYAFTENFLGYKDVSLTIVGDGKEKKKLERLVHHLKAETQIKFTGVLDREKVVEEVSKANVLICFSKSETFGVTVIEAWACGKPVIVSTGIGFLEYWREDLGIIVPWDSREELGKQMKIMHKNYAIYQKDKIRDFAKTNFSKETVYKQLEKIYLEITS